MLANKCCQPHIRLSLQAVEDMCLHKMADRLYSQLQKVRPAGTTNTSLQQHCSLLHGLREGIVCAFVLSHVKAS